jgi:uncharacterized membrane protein YgdD (TMEM256/DUF423 family)
MKKTQIISASVLGFLGVALGAFGAHGLKSIVTPELLETYKTGVFYHLVHAAVLLAISLSGYQFNKSFYSILAGVVLFSFSLYIYAISEIKFLVFITPLGGITMLIGWLLLIYDVLKKDTN